MIKTIFRALKHQLEIKWKILMKKIKSYMLTKSINYKYHYYKMSCEDKQNICKLSFSGNH